MVEIDWQSALLIADEIVDLVMREQSLDIVDLRGELAGLLNDRDGQEWDGVQWQRAA